ncbi:hypothetical protein F4677DRAFT_172184 [Hypoxylon crocopeplum]|nr:hypothetical protein F4677DRAFT_172184 [Hypoxylon crocopeplum]
MATPGPTQALLAAFFFGILFNAASAALVLYVIGHGSAIFRDGLRLVLILFLTSSAAWALVEFLATIIEPTAASTCQVAAIFSSVFDQMGRVFIEQYLIWAARTEGQKKALSVMPQVLVLGRFGVGIAFVALTGSDFNPTCVPVSNVLPVAIAAIVLDAIILVLVVIQALSMGSTKDINRKRGVMLVTIGLAIWIGTSVILLLGMRATELVLKTTLPALGLAILVALVTVFSGTLVTPRGPPPRRPDSPTTRDISNDRDLSSSDSADYPPSRYEDVKTMNTRVIAAYASRNDGTVPAISMPVTQMSGIGGLEDHGNMKKMAKENAWAKATGGKLVISNPVLMQEEGMGNPLDRIPTIDLATAANNERERRIKLAQRGSALIAQRPAPQPPNALAQGRMLARETSMKRKEVAPSSSAVLERSVSTKTTKTTGGLSVEANASSTSSELSPGTEKIRRRSPRQPLPPPIPAAFQPVRPGEPIRIPIPRPRDPPQSPKAPEPVKTPLQRRPTTGLPSNPRAQAMKAMANEAKSQRQETVMFVNNIVYDDPSVVNNIVQGASKTPMTSLDSAGSVVNRPRPIPRKGDKDRQVFPAELSPGHGHKRSKSSGSVASRKSILQSMPGSPTQLPPLPPPPKSAGNAPRPLPNDTKSMTFDEKMDFLYTAPLSAPSMTTTTSKQRSSVPEMPPLPATYMMDTQLPGVEDVPDPEANSDRRVSKTTDRSSIRTTSILGIEDIPQRLTQRAAISRNAVDELGQSWLPGISAENERRRRPSREKTNRRSSPVIPIESHFSVSSMKSGSRARDEDATTIWGSVHSPIAVVDVQQSRRNARSTYIQKDHPTSEMQIEQGIPPAIPSEVMTIALDHTERLNNSHDTVHLKDDKALPEVPAVHANSGPFHRRVGDECPTFSTRKERGRLRKMPPPAPLILNGRSSKKTIIVQAAEPSPLESPEVAYQMIQAQLQRFEQPSRESTESQGQRLALLENLEREMGQLENKWQTTQTRLERDSMSSIRTSPSKDSRPTSIAAERRASRRLSMRNSVVRSKGEDSMGMLSSQSSGMSSENTHASLWQARLAEAQMEYMKSTPDLIMKRNNLNFLSVSKAALGSPSPPDTDESEYENEAPDSVQPLSSKSLEPVIQPHKLWRPQSPIRLQINSGLWEAMSKKTQMASETGELPGPSVRPTARKTMVPLTIDSSRLWQRPADTSNDGAMSGLWKKTVPSQDSESNATTRPVTIRPPRRNKRVTLLPDILENPEPLPDKRGTLGIFQFPWGEKSEHATIQPRPNRMYMAMPGTMTSGGPSGISASLDARSKRLEAEEFTTSFFDDYEAEEEGDNFDDYLDSDGEGDDFDENTLWEIASLLRTEKIPSKNSLLPPPQQTSTSVNSPVSVYNVAEMSEDDYRDDGMVLEEPIPVDGLHLSTPESYLARSLLWTAHPEALQIHHTYGLPQPDSTIWNAYTTQTVRMARSNVHIEETTPIQSNKLWQPRAGVACRTSSGLLWSVSRPVHSTLSRASPIKTIASPTEPSLLWVQPTATLAPEVPGLFDISYPRADYRKTSKEPAALQMTTKSRATEVPLQKLTSKNLWAGNLATEVPFLWEKPLPAHALERDGLFDNSSSRSEYRRTAKEPAAIYTRRTPRTTEEPLAVLKTNKLWSRETPATSAAIRGPQLFTSKKSVVPASQSSKAEAIPNVQVTSLWEKPKTNSEPEHDGLFDISISRNNYRRSSKIPAAISISKQPRATKEPLPTLATTSLWSGGPVERKLSVTMTKSPPEPEGVPTPAEANLMWEKSTLAVLESDHEGLFDVGIARTEYRRTSKLPAAIGMTRKSRKMGQPLATLTSTKLWAVQSVLAYVPASGTASLWNRPATSMASLFQLDPKRKVYRTTSADPAALQVVRKPRLIDEPLPRIESNRLWTSSQITSVELDWITISSVRPDSPSVASVSTASSSPSSPVTGSSSVKTSTTKASSAKGVGGFFGGWFGKKAKESETPKVPEESALKAAPEIPVIPELHEEFVVKNLDEIPRRKPTHSPLRQLHRPSVAYRANWGGELREAIAQSYPGTMAALRASYPQDSWELALQAAIKASHMQPRITRKAASPREWSVALHEAIASSYPEIRFSRGQTLPAQWEAALQEAIASSHPPQTTEFDVAIRHPVFMGSMETTAEITHPAVSPKALTRRGSAKEKTFAPRSVDFDVAIRHPVFFGSMESTADTAHPAIDLKTLKQSTTRNAMSAPLLWANPVKARVTAIEGLWTPSNGSSPGAQTASPFGAQVEMAPHSPRKINEMTRESEIEVDAEFGSQGMWRRGERRDSRAQNRDWLEDSMKKRFTRIELRY